MGDNRQDKRAACHARRYGGWPRLDKRRGRHGIWVILMGLGTIVMFMPILIMLTTAVKPIEEIRTFDFHIFPQHLILWNFIEAMKSGEWLVYFRNSVIVTALAVAFSMVFNSIAGYAFARLRFRGSRMLFIILLIGLMMPPQVTMLPTFLIMAKFPFMGGNDLLGAGGTGLINTYAGLIIPMVSGSFGVFLCKQFYENFPRSLDEAAKIDGTNPWQTYFLIYLPNSKAILATLALLKGVGVWNDYLWPLVMTNSENRKTVQLALTMFRTSDYIQWGQLMAASVLVVLPMVILFLCAQKYFVQGIVTSGLK